MDETISSDILNSLLASPSVIKLIVERTTHLLLVNVLRHKKALDSAAVQVLTAILQRHGAIFSETSLKLLAATEDGGDRQLLDEVLHSITFVSSRFFCFCMSNNLAMKYICSHQLVPETRKSG